MSKKVRIPLIILAFWAVYYFQNHYDKTPEADKSPKEQATKVVKQSAPVDINEKKQHFFDTLRPGMQKENARVLAERKILLELQKEMKGGESIPKPSSEIQQLAQDYDVAIPETGIDQAWLDTMLNRVNVLPQALVLTQAANESAWGSSRFAKQGNNFFGQWCYVEGCGLVPLKRVEGATHEVAKFDSPQQSIHAYFMNVNRNDAYKALRDIRAQLAKKGEDLKSQEAALALTDGLLSYSERGQDYVDDLQSMIKHNSDYWTVK
ncbi:glucosaminidase domain-containing protein [Vibrio gangliei]|uniref:glucosaminidase domain-containing protein n=1 Tax=Vibrio gangliei TaxID=2077090 RepID=UPI000D01886A|nr:glucosaminidase domain-containing protein [Vibrio gangliei]